MTLTVTIQDLIYAALSKLGVNPRETEAQNIEDAQRNLNMMLDLWSADSDLSLNDTIPLGGYASLSDTLYLPKEYEVAIVLNLAILLAPDYNQSVSPALAMLAEQSIMIIKRKNFKNMAGDMPRNALAPTEV